MVQRLQGLQGPRARLQAEVGQHRPRHPHDERVRLPRARALVGACDKHAHHRYDERECRGGVRQSAVPEVHDDDSEEGLARLDDVREGDGEQRERHVGEERATQQQHGRPGERHGPPLLRQLGVAC